jgi:hypothetical protein
MCIARPTVGYRALVETCRARANELAISRSEIDRLAGLAAGYSAKLLGKDNSAPRKKKMWPTGLELILETLGLAIIVVEDHAAKSRTLARRVPVVQSHQRFENKSNPPKPKIAAGGQPPQIEKPQRDEPVSRAHLRVVQTKRRGSKYA